MMFADERDPKKRKVKPVESAQQLLDFDLEESSDDSDFRIEDHAEESDDYDSLNSDDDANDDGSDDSDDSSDSDNDKQQNSTKVDKNKSINDIIQEAKNRINPDGKLDKKINTPPVCAGCLGDRSDDANEIVECDGCGTTVHEGCYGVSDSASVSSTVSSCSTEPWFCEACKAGVMNPQCELCPNEGGIFKETDVGKWVHLVCALYVPGVAFGEVDHLSSVTLFEMPYNKWGAKVCCLCEDERFARTGVCIGCDAGMCKTYFHVTCAQKEGLLSEAHTEEVDQADPFYAHCKLHSDKTLIRKRKRNFLALQLQTRHKKQEREIIQQDDSENDPTQQRIQRKLKKHRTKYLHNKTLKSAPWVPTQKMPRLLTTSASACKKLLLKAELMGIDTEALETQDVHVQALLDVRKKWNVPPAFSVEFIGYYLDRNKRVTSMKEGLQQLLEANTKLLGEQKSLRDRYDEAMKDSTEHSRRNISLKQTIAKFHAVISDLCPEKQLPSVDSLGQTIPVIRTSNKLSPVVALGPRTSTDVIRKSMGVPTAAALKMGVGFPLNHHNDGESGGSTRGSMGERGNSGKVLSTSKQESLPLNNECGICKKRHDQHLLAKCDVCHLYYHLGCLNPPLTRLPKKSKLYGWQCSECDKSSESEPDITQPKAPRKSRTRYSKDGTIIPASVFESNDNSTHAEDKESVINNMHAVSNEAGNAAKTESLSGVGSGSLKFTIKSVDKLSSSGDTNYTAEITNMSQELDQNIEFVKKTAKSKSNKKSRKEKRNHLTQESYFVQQQSNAIEDNAVNQFGDNSFLSEGSTFRPNIEGNGEPLSTSSNILSDPLSISPTIDAHRQNRKRRKEKHRNRYSPDFMRSPSKEHKRKRKKKSQDDIENPNEISGLNKPRITIKIKSIPLPAGEVASTSNPQMFYVPSDSNDAPPAQLAISQISITESDPSTNLIETVANDQTQPSSFLTPPMNSKKPMNRRSSTNTALTVSSQKAKGSQQEGTPAADDMICDVCTKPGTNQNTARCDECLKCYHFTCLDPPVKKSPKRRGYSWHCADCDPTETDST